MKAIPLALLFSLPLVLTAAEVQPGDSLFDVRATLGAPRGQMQIGDRHLLYYDRGEVQLQAGTVTRVALLSVEDQAALEAKRAADAIRIRDEQAIRRAHLGAEGEALKARKLADPAFQSAPVAYQVAFWEDFSRRYSDVPSAEELTLARLRLAGEQEQKRARAEEAGRLADLEARVANAEARAAEAEAAAAHAQNYSSFGDYASYVSYPYPSYYGRSRNRSHSSSPDLWPIRYQYFEAPLPYATSASLPPMQPNNRNEYNSTFPTYPSYTNYPNYPNYRNQGDNGGMNGRHNGRNDGAGRPPHVRVGL